MGASFANASHFSGMVRGCSGRTERRTGEAAEDDGSLPNCRAEPFLQGKDVVSYGQTGGTW